MFNLLSGLMRPTSGRIELDGPRHHARPPSARTQAGLGRTFQISSVFPLLSVLENVRLAAEARLGGAMRIWRRASCVREAVERARWALARVGLEATEPRCRRARSRTATSGSSSWRCCSRPTSR